MAISPGLLGEMAICDEVKKRKAIRKISDSSGDEEEPILCNSSDSENDEREEDNCVGCGENYYKTQLVEDWLQCTICELWAHENCTEFDNMCSKCGQKKKKELKEAKTKGKGIGKSSTGHLSSTNKAITPGPARRDGQS